MDAYICGHDHISEHLQVNRKVDYFWENGLFGQPQKSSFGKLEIFVAGAGSMIDTLSSVPYTSEAKLVWYGVGYSAFAYMNATLDTLSIGYVDVHGNETYTYTMVNCSGDGCRNDVSVMLMVGMGVLSILVLAVVCVWWLRYTGEYTNIAGRCVDQSNHTNKPRRTWGHTHTNTHTYKDMLPLVSSNANHATIHPAAIHSTLHAQTYTPAHTHTHTQAPPSLSANGIDVCSDARLCTHSSLSPSLHHQSTHTEEQYGYGNRNGYGNLTSDDEDEDGDDWYEYGDGAHAIQEHVYIHRRSYTAAV